MGLIFGTPSNRSSIYFCLFTVVSFCIFQPVCVFKASLLPPLSPAPTLPKSINGGGLTRLRFGTDPLLVCAAVAKANKHLNSDPVALNPYVHVWGGSGVVHSVILKLHTFDLCL